MSWFTDTTNCPKIVDETLGRVEPISFVLTGGTIKTWHRTISSVTKRFMHLTQAAADSIAAAKNADTAHDYTAASVRENDANAYMVRLVEKVTGAWET